MRPECGGSGNRNRTPRSRVGAATFRACSRATRVSSVFALRARFAVCPRIESASVFSR